MNLKPLFLSVLLATIYTTANAATTTVEKNAPDATATSTAVPASAESALGKAVDKVTANGDSSVKPEKVTAETHGKSDDKSAKKVVKKPHAQSTHTSEKMKANTGEEKDNTKNKSNDTQ
ncbi:hypothetical protein QUF31_12865 [Dickeya chrysanthemi]|uniref:hypothetical protein n=1 Tax=Dickeya chrysanthemi TaxID=556 RepID=UPI0025A20BC3|nr:hypothetical protein [Dickeya chrysanthemi]WJM84057.1 hypothetical protein QUF31_12865 [Dickeya chrysanthemi]